MGKNKNSNPFSVRHRLLLYLFVLAGFPFIKKIEGSRNLRGEGPFIIAANHASHIDWFFLFMRFASIMDRYLHTFATTIGYKNLIYRFLVDFTQCIWMDPKSKMRAIYTALEYLKRGEVIGIFPEGTRSPDGKIRKGKSGIAALALQAKVSVVPVGLINTHKVLPRGAVFPRFARCEANIGEPLKFDDYYKDYDEAVGQNDQPRIAKIQEEVVRIIMREIARLSNQEYRY
jgi:1-acyl-sn-glycerol-3-phosphate acyltransferase